MGRSAEDVDGRAVLDGGAGVHNKDRFGKPGDHAKVVSHQDRGHISLVPQPAQQLDDLGLSCDVERARRLVGNEELGLTRECHGDHGPLALPPGQLVGVLLKTMFGIGELDLVEQLQRHTDCILAADPPVCSHRLTYLRPDGPHGVQGRFSVLEHD